MVRSKEVPKKPKDPLLTPPSKPRGFSFRDDGGFGGSLPRNRGGAAMSSPAPASVPNYMRATNSSGAKSGQRQRAGAPSSASASPARQRTPARVLTRGKVLFPEPAATASPGMVRPTCSSTLKETKFPSALDLAPGATDAEGPAAMRVCPYNYCSLNGHTHSPAVPLRSFLATRRRLIKTQQSMKHKGVSAFRKGTGHQSPEDKIVCAGGVAKAAPPLVDEEALGDFFVEVYSGPRVSSGTSCSDMSLDEMDATVRRMEFVVFDRCGADDDSEKGNDLGVSDDGEGRPEDRPGVCRDSSSECSGAGISGNLVEELPWMRYQVYECDSLDDDVSEEQGVIHEEIGETEVLAQGQEGKGEEGTSGGLGDEREEEADEEQKPENEEIISDLSREMGIVAEEEGFGCRVDTMHQQEASTGQETQHPGDDEDCSWDVAHNMEIAAEQACNVCTVEICKDQGEKDEDNILDKVCQGDNSDGQGSPTVYEVAGRVENVIEDPGTSEEKVYDGVCELEIPEYEVAGRVENVIEDHEAKDDETNMDSAGQSEIAEKQKDGESEMEIPEYEVAGRVENVIEDHEAKDDETNMDSAGQSEIAEKQKDGESEMEVSKTVPNVACKENFFEQEEISEAVSEGEIFGSGAIGSHVEISNQPANGGFEQDVNTVEDASEQYGGIINNSFEQLDTTAENTVSGTKDAQKGLEITTCKSEDASEESDITQESNQDFNSVCVDAPAKMEPEITERKPEDSSQESSIPQESSQSDKSAHVSNGAQIEVCVDDPAQMEPGITERKPEDSSEESGIPQESSQSDVNNGAEEEPELTACKSEDPSEESGIAQEIVHDDDSVCLGEGAQMQLGNVTSDLEEASEESGIAQEIGEDDNSAFEDHEAKDDETNMDSAGQLEIAEKQKDGESKMEVSETVPDVACKENFFEQEEISEAVSEGEISGSVTSDLEEASEESGIAQEIGEDDNSAFDAQNDSEITTCELSEQDVSGGAQNESELTPSELANATDLSGGAQNEPELTPSQLENASEPSDATQEAVSDDNTADVNDGPQKDSEIIACESEHAHEEVEIITQEGNGDDYSASALKEAQITRRETKDASEEVCITEEANLMSIVQTPQHNSDHPATDAHGQPQNLPAEDTDMKEFSVDDMCNVFSGMNLKGDVYVDPTESEISPRKRLIIAGRRRTAEEEEYMRGFNPRAPNFLPLELDPDSEKVDLKHQTAEDRKNAEEWMIDYALRRAVNNLGARKKKVELLVQAFETVLPHEEDDKKNISPTRPAQACN